MPITTHDVDSSIIANRPINLFRDIRSSGVQVIEPGD
jgi:hypothetical protein